MRLIVLVPLLFFAQIASAQVQSTTTKSKFTLQVTENTIVRDSLGNRIPFPILIRMISGGDYTLDPVRDKNGNPVEYRIRKTVKGDDGKRETILQSPGEGNLPKPEVGSVLPDVELMDIDSQLVKLSDLKGKVIVINFWFSLCKPCLYEIPAINEMAAAYKDRDDIVFLAPNWEKRDAILRFMDLQKMTYRVFPEAYTLVDAMKIRAYPTNLIIGKDHKVSASFAGGLPGIEGVLKKEIEIALSKTY